MTKPVRSNHTPALLPEHACQLPAMARAKQWFGACTEKEASVLQAAPLTSEDQAQMACRPFMSGAKVIHTILAAASVALTCRHSCKTPSRAA